MHAPRFVPTTRLLIQRLWQNQMPAVSPHQYFLPIPPRLMPFFSTCNVLYKRGDKRAHREDVPDAQEGVEGERLPANLTTISAYPTLETHETEFDGVKFKHLPVVYVTCSMNNTKVFIFDRTQYGQGSSSMRSGCLASGSCGTEGFFKAKKGTNVAGQAVAFNVGKRCVDKGVATVRVVLSGHGPGRTSAVRGLQMAGMKIVSISDWSPMPMSFAGVWTTPQKPRKAKRL